MFFGCCTSERGLGRPFIPTPDVSSPVSRRMGLHHPQTQGDAYGGVTWSQLGDGSMGGPIGIGLQAIQLWPCHAGLAGPRFADLTFPASPACSGPPYLSVVRKPDDPSSSPKSLLLAKGIQHQIARRTSVPYRHFSPRMGATARSQGRQPLDRTRPPNPPRHPDPSPGDRPDWGRGAAVTRARVGLAILTPGADAPGYVLSPPFGGFWNRL